VGCTVGYFLAVCVVGEALGVKCMVGYVVPVYCAVGLVVVVVCIEQ